MGWVSFYILSYSCLASVLGTWFSCTCIIESVDSICRDGTDTPIKP